MGDFPCTDPSKRTPKTAAIRGVRSMRIAIGKQSDDAEKHSEPVIPLLVGTGTCRAEYPGIVDQCSAAGSSQVILAWSLGSES